MKAIRFVGTGSLAMTLFLVACVDEPSTSNVARALGDEPSSLESPIVRDARPPQAPAPIAQPLVPGAKQVGYYDLAFETGADYEVPPIVAAGGTAVRIDDPNAAALVNLNVLFVTNPFNATPFVEYLGRVPDIGAAVQNGMVLVLHDRDVQQAQSLLPGAGGIGFVRGGGDPADINIRDGSTVVTAGLDDASLDGGNSSNHGFADAGTLPANSKLILISNSPSNIVTFCYPLGKGSVIYSTIPLDFYLAGQGPAQPQQNLVNIYAPNVVSYALAGACNKRVGPRPTPNFHN